MTSTPTTHGGVLVGSRWERLLDATRLHPLRTDIGLAIGFGVAMTLSCWGGYLIGTPAERAGMAWWSAPVAVVAMALVAWRRRYPELQFIGSLGLYVVAGFGGVPDAIVGVVWVWVGIYGLGCYGGRFRTHVRLLGVLVVEAALIALDQQQAATAGTTSRGPATAFILAIILGFLASAWLFGDTTRIRRQQAVDLALRAYELVLEHDRNAERAVTEERLRIARELHDVMAHHVTVIGIQAAAAERVLERDPAVARSAMRIISTQSRDTIEELQRLLGFLRPTGGDPAGDGPLSPQPSILNVGRLVADSRAAGLEVTLVSAGDLDALPGSVSMSAYRIVQEALTNVRKHALGSRAFVRVEVDAGRTTIRVHNGPVKVASGNPPSAPVIGSGFGLVGMRERVRLVGGELVVGPSSDGGWLVEALLPTRATPIP